MNELHKAMEALTALSLKVVTKKHQEAVEQAISAIKSISAVEKVGHLLVDTSTQGLVDIADVRVNDVIFVSQLGPCLVESISPNWPEADCHVVSLFAIALNKFGSRKLSGTVAKVGVHVSRDGSDLEFKVGDNFC